MHLIELIATLEAVKVARGNILLIDVGIMASGDSEPLVDHTDRKPRMAPVREQIDLTGLSEEQEQELRAETPNAIFVRNDVAHPAKEPCNLVDVAKGRCTLEIGHEGDHVWQNPEAELDHTAKEVEKEIGAGQLADVMSAAAANLPDLEGKDSEVAMPCPQWDGKGHACVLAFGHDGDHVFVHSINNVSASGSASSEGGEPVTIPIPDTPQE